PAREFYFVLQKEIKTRHLMAAVQPSAPTKLAIGRRRAGAHHAIARGAHLRIARSRPITRMKRDSRVESHAKPYCDRTAEGNCPAASTERIGEIALRPSQPPTGVSNAAVSARACALTVI